jgi:hypothetical protein
MSEQPERRDILGYNRHAWDRQVELIGPVMLRADTFFADRSGSGLIAYPSRVVAFGPIINGLLSEKCHRNTGRIRRDEAGSSREIG